MKKLFLKFLHSRSGNEQIMSDLAIYQDENQINNRTIVTPFDHFEELI